MRGRLETIDDTVRARSAVILLAASAVVFLPGMFDPYVWPKVAVAALGVAVAATVAPRGRLPRDVALVLGLGLVVLLVAALVGPTPRASLLGRFPRYEGLPVLALYAGCAWAGARVVGLRTTGTRSPLTWASAGVATVLALAYVLERAGLPLTPATESTRTGLVVGNATDLGIVAMLAFALLLGPALRERDRVAVVGLVAAVVALAGSASRAVLLVSGLVLVAHLVQWRAAGRRVLVPLAATTAVLLVAMLTLPVTRDRLLDSGTVTGRRLLWGESWELVVDHPWAGVGPSRFVDAIGRYHDDAWVERVGVAAPPDSPHLWLLQAWASGGVVLLVLAVLLAVLVARSGVRRVRADPSSLGLLCAVVGYGIVLLTHFTTPATSCWVMVLLGALVAVPPSDRTGRGAAVLASSVGLVAVAGAACALLFVRSDVRLLDGVEAAAVGEVQAADEAFEDAFGARLHDGDVAMLAAQALAGPASAGSTEAADSTVVWAERSLRGTPDTFASGLALAVAEVSQGRLGEAERRLDALTERFPTEPQAYTQRSIARFGQGRLDEALADLDEAQRLDPDAVEPARLRAAMVERAAEVG